MRAMLGEGNRDEALLHSSSLACQSSVSEASDA